MSDRNKPSKLVIKQVQLQDKICDQHLTESKESNISGIAAGSIIFNSYFDNVKTNSHKRYK